MKKLLALLVLLIIPLNLYAANEWRGATGENTILGTSNVSDIDTNSYQKVVAPIDRLLANYRQGMGLTYTSASTLTIAAGEVVCSNSAATIRKFRQNTTTTATTFSNLDTGSEAPSTTYYVYAICDADATTATFKYSASSTTPSGATYYKRLGTFYNNSGSDIEQIANDNSLQTVATGTVANGGTISVPSGYSSDQCKWFVSSSSTSTDPGTSDAVRDMKQTASVSASRLVSCSRQRVYASTTENLDNVCNYIIICFQ